MNKKKLFAIGCKMKDIDIGNCIIVNLSKVSSNFIERKIFKGIDIVFNNNNDVKELYFRDNRKSKFWLSLIGNKAKMVNYKSLWTDILFKKVDLIYIEVYREYIRRINEEKEYEFFTKLRYENRACIERTA